MRRAIPYPCRGPSTSRVFSTINASVPWRTSVLSFIGFPIGSIPYSHWENNRSATSLENVGDVSGVPYATAEQDEVARNYMARGQMTRHSEIALILRSGAFVAN